VRAQVDRDLTTVSWVDWLLGLIKNLGCHIGAAPASGPLHGDGREVGQNEEEFKGNRFRLLPWAGVLLRGRSTAGGGAARGGGRGGTGGGDGGLGGEGEMVVEVRGATKSRIGPFIGAGRSVRVRIFDL
jgi:hypothetical protein